VAGWLMAAGQVVAVGSRRRALQRPGSSLRSGSAAAGQLVAVGRGGSGRLVAMGQPGEVSQWALQ
jgi:hypothetical protein